MKHYTLFTLVTLLFIGALAYAQEQAPTIPVTPPPALSPDEQARFEAARTLSTLAIAEAQVTREYRAYLAAQRTLEARLKAFQDRRNELPAWKAYAAHRIQLDQELAKRGVQVNWDTGAVSTTPSTPKR